MKKIKTKLFWKVLLGYAAIFIIIRFLVDLLIEEIFWQPRRILGILITGFAMGIFMAFYTKPKPKRITNFHEVE